MRSSYSAPLPPPPCPALPVLSGVWSRHREPKTLNPTTSQLYGRAIQNPKAPPPSRCMVVPYKSAACWVASLRAWRVMRLWARWTRTWSDGPSSCVACSTGWGEGRQGGEEGFGQATAQLAVGGGRAGCCAACSTDGGGGGAAVQRAQQAGVREDRGRVRAGSCSACSTAWGEGRGGEGGGERLIGGSISGSACSTGCRGG